MEGGPPGFTRDFSCPALLRYGIGPLGLCILGSHHLWPDVPDPVLLAFVVPRFPPYNPRGQALGFGLFRFRSPLLTESRLLSFPPGTEMFHFPGLALAALWIQAGVPGLQPGGLPHSEILGSMPACGSPRLFAACHVLRRLPAPRHPPYALSSLTRFQLSWRLDKSDLSRCPTSVFDFQRTLSAAS